MTDQQILNQAAAELENLAKTVNLINRTPATWNALARNIAIGLPSGYSVAVVISGEAVAGEISVGNIYQSDGSIQNIQTLSAIVDASALPASVEVEFHLINGSAADFTGASVQLEAAALNGFGLTLSTQNGFYAGVSALASFAFGGDKLDLLENGGAGTSIYYIGGSDLGVSAEYGVTDDFWGKAGDHITKNIHGLGGFIQGYLGDNSDQWYQDYKSDILELQTTQDINNVLGFVYDTAYLNSVRYVNEINNILDNSELFDLFNVTSNIDYDNLNNNNFILQDDGISYIDISGNSRVNIVYDENTESTLINYNDQGGNFAFSIEQNVDDLTTFHQNLDGGLGAADYFFDFGGQLTGFEQKDAGGEVVLHGYVSTIHNPDGTTQVVTTREGTEEANNVKWTTEVVTRRGPTPEQIALGEQLKAERTGGANLGALFGSTLGSIIGGDNVFARVAVGTVLSAVLSNIGDAIALQGETASKAVAAGLEVDEAFDSFGNDLGNAFRSQAIGAVSSFLTGELTEALDIGDEFGGALFSYAGNKAISSVLNNVIDGKDLFDGFSGELFTNSGAGPAFQASFGAFVGGYLGNQVVAAETQAGAIAGSLGGTLGAAIGAGLAGISTGFLGSIATFFGVTVIVTATSVLTNFLLPGIGAFIGTILGNIIGDFISDIFGWDTGPDSFWGQQQVAYDAADGAFKRGSLQFDSDITNTDINNLRAMADSAIDVLNNYMDTLGGTVVSVRAPSFYMAWTASQNYFRVTASGGGDSYHTSDGSGLVENTVLSTLKDIQIAGGDPYLKRALANSQATTLEQLNGELQMAADYAAYMENKGVIDAIIAQDSQSAFSAAWDMRAANDNTQTETVRRMAA